MMMVADEMRRRKVSKGGQGMPKSNQLGCWKCGGRGGNFNVLWGRCSGCLNSLTTYDVVAEAEKIVKGTERSVTS